ncbi:MAG: hypothetical protein ABI557_02855 [Aureliella sp.]
MACHRASVIANVVDGSPHEYDLKQLGLDDPALSFSNEAAPNGAQLRVYYKSGVAYIAYFAN